MRIGAGRAFEPDGIDEGIGRSLMGRLLIQPDAEYDRIRGFRANRLIYESFRDMLEKEF